ncbi:MAG: LPS assembly protein LptD [Candidatus Gygaella obscura]|nr:LPS assembly protein LptD [Candidatus Gygaella obscura]
MLLFGVFFNCFLFAQETKEPYIVKGDKMEYTQAENIVIIDGDAVIIHKGSKLTADKITYNNLTHDARAQGDVRLVFESGVLTGENVVYNFDSKIGYVLNANLYADPFYLQAPIIDKIDENEFGMKRGYFTTCNHDKVHWRIKSKKIDVYPDDRITAKSSIFFIGNIPLFYFPRFTQNLKENVLRVQVEPGYSKDWGMYLLTAWRYYVSENLMGRIHVDFREKKDMAVGIDAKYDTVKYGKGILRTYYMNERDAKRDHFWEKWTDEESLGADETERFRVQLRHIWDIDETSQLIGEYNKLHDSQVIKDYFFDQEYEQEETEDTYLQLTKNYRYSTLSAYLNKRVNRFESITEKLPELKLDTSSFKILDSPFYVKNNSTASYLHSTNANSAEDDVMKKVDTYTEIAMPFKVLFFELRPYFGSRQTYFSKDVDGASISPRVVNYNGISLNTKFYRLFDLVSDFAGFDINRLRHIISPTIEYDYTHNPTIGPDRLAELGNDNIEKSKSITLSLENKLQTKRNNKSVDLIRFILDSTYDLTPKTKRRLSDVGADLEIIPYDWLEINADAGYDTTEHWFKTVNFDLTAKPFDRWSASIGHRYERKGTKELTTDFKYRLNPLWKFRFYHRYQFATGDLLEQEYGITRDLHCWFMDINYNVNRSKGETIWVVFRLKAFPETEFGFEQDHHAPKSGSQSTLGEYQ